MSLKLLTASNTERHEANLVGQHLITNRYFNTDKSIEKFINTFEKSEEITRLSRNAIVNDPTVNGFKLFFHFSAKSGLLADEIYPNSALKYFNDIDDTYRYNLLKSFIGLLSDINTNHNWVFNSIEGLREIYTNPHEAVSFKAETNKIIISCYETIDYKIAALNKMWREIYWDKTRGVLCLPENLRQFSMSVYILDMRVFRSNFKFLRSAETKSIAEVNHQVFDIGCCQFHTDSGGEFFESTTNASIQETRNNLVFGFETTDVSGIFASYLGNQDTSKDSMRLVNTVIGNRDEDFSMDSLIKKSQENIEDNISNYGKNQAAYFAHQEVKLLNRNAQYLQLLQNVKSAVIDVNELTYGNVQGAGIQNLINNI